MVMVGAGAKSNSKGGCVDIAARFVDDVSVAKAGLGLRRAGHTLMPNMMTFAQELTPSMLALRERCSTLEQQLAKVTMERDIVKSLYDQLASAVRLPLGTNLAGPNKSVLFLQTANEKRPTRETHPLVKFWMQKDYDTWLESPEALMGNQGKYAFLEDENGSTLAPETVKVIRRAVRAGWTELVNHSIAPKTWGKASASARQTFHAILEREFPIFKLAENGWKLEYLCTKMYSAWCKHHLNENGQWKTTVKEEDDSDEDSDKKRKSQEKLTRTSGKKMKVDVQSGKDQDVLTIQPQPPAVATDTGVATPDQNLQGRFESPAVNELIRKGSVAAARPTLSPIAYSPAPPARAQSPIQSGPTAGVPCDEDPTAASSNKENVPSHPHSQVAGSSPVIVCNPLSILTAAASKAKIMSAQLPPLPIEPCAMAESSLAKGSASVPGPSSNCVPGSSKARTKLRPSSNKNGRWLKQVKPDGDKDEYRNYYDRTLHQQQREAYDKEAKELVEKNCWVVKAVIENGNLY
ncbi:hypothetical protein EDD15DRAFT_2203594 [Pisolithus albus]|nr:hypothetical protein EDD15DRAFT_2203594 [Pisolithus albus]